MPSYGLRALRQLLSGGSIRPSAAPDLVLGELDGRDGAAASHCAGPEQWLRVIERRGFVVIGVGVEGEDQFSFTAGLSAKGFPSSSSMGSSTVMRTAP